MTVPPASSFPGPAALGRGVVVAPGAPTPPGFERARRLVIDDEVLAHPRACADVLFHHWLHRRRVVIEMVASNAAARRPETIDLPPYRLAADAGLHRERLHLLTWANNYDLRSGTPLWWHGELACRRTGATAPTTPAGDRGSLLVGDVTLPDGNRAWVDGGPRGPLAVPLTGDEDLSLVHRESIMLARLTLPGPGRPPADARLAEDQLAAVAHRAGPARVIAPAGSGKTRVLTARLRHLLTDRGVEPELVTTVAYNARAAAELRDRTRDLRTSIRTLHALALWICNMDERRRVIQEREVRRLLDDLVRTGRTPNQDPFQPYLEALSEVRLALRDPETVESSRGDVDGFSALFDDYRARLADDGLLDFDEQIYRAIELLLTRPDIRARAQRAGTHLLVDEFQDLTPAFLLLIRLVAGPTMQVFAVGDDDQTIYSYAGASPDYLVQVERWFPGAAHHALEVNYRCPPTVVEAAVNLLGHNRARVHKTIRSEPADDRATAGSQDDRTPALRVHRTEPGQMATAAVELIRGHLDARVEPREIAVLARVNSALLPVQVALTEAGVAHTAPLDATVLGRTGVRTALAYLRLGLDLDRIRREDLLDTINRPARKVKSAVQPLLRTGRLSIEHLEQVADALGPTHQERFAAYLADLRVLEGAITQGADTRECLRIIQERIGLGEAMDALDSSRTRPEGSSHADDLDALLQLAHLHPDPATFREWLTDRLRVEADPAGVTLSSVHRVKGMECQHVVVFAANAGLFPHRLADDLEEERRIFHVALTRCRTTVAVVADRDRPSPFTDELSRAATGSPTGTGPDRARTDRRTDTEPPPLVRDADDGTTQPRPGAQVALVGGFRGHVREVDADGIEVVVAPAEPDDPPVVVRLAYGESVVVDERPTVLARRRPPMPTRALGIAPDTDDGAVDEALFEALRRWRARVAADVGVPAYLVFHDQHLRSLSARKPRAMRELARCPGVGPTKLERYGEDLLELIDLHG